MRLAIAASALVLAAGCSPAVQSAMFVSDTPAPRPTQSPLRIYSEARPECSLQEIGTVSGYARAPGQSPDDVANAMRARARKMGGDAIVGFATQEVVSGGVAVPAGAGSVASISSNTVYKGTVVRFDDPSCNGQGQ